jgi:SAM-dependent methyltransferase
VAKLRSSGARAEHGVVSKLPFADGAFGLVAAFDVVEHVDDDDAALAEIARVASLGATVLLSVPLYAARWTKFDELVGHRRRYEPGDLVAKLARHGLSVSGTAAYGMQPRSPFVVWIGIFWLTYLRTFAIWWYDRIIVHFGARFQTALALTPGMMDVAEVDELLVACKKTAREDA